MNLHYVECAIVIEFQNSHMKDNHNSIDTPWLLGSIDFIIINDNIYVPFYLCRRPMKSARYDVFAVSKLKPKNFYCRVERRWGKLI